MLLDSIQGLFLSLSGPSILVAGSLVVLLISAICVAQATAHREFQSALFALAGSMLCGAFTMFIYALPITDWSTTSAHFDLVSGSASMWLVMLSISRLLLDRKDLRWVFFVGGVALLGHLLASDYFTRRTWNSFIQLLCGCGAIFAVLISKRNVSNFSKYLAVSLFGLFSLSLLPHLTMLFKAAFFVPDHSLFGRFVEVKVWRALVWTVSSVLAYAVTIAFVFSLMSNKLLGQVETDFLTGLRSRRRIFEIGDEWFRKSHTKVAALLIDIDHFKAINDRYGHQVGDEALRLCATRMQDVVRKTDSVVARYGGEEFCILLSNTELNEAQAIGERIRDAIASKPFFIEGQELAITVSLGLATRDPSMSLTGLLAWADKCLYQAKSQGRNRIVTLAPGLVPAV